MKKSIILGVIGIGMVTMAQAEFIVIQESVAKDPYPASLKVIEPPTPQAQRTADVDAAYLQTVTEMERLRAENVALRNQLVRKELGPTSESNVYGNSSTQNTYQALSRGKYRITAKQAKALAKSVNAAPGIVTILGFTDSTGSVAINQRTGLNRANGFRNLLVAHGAKKSKLRAEYRVGEYIASNKTANGRAANRRVQIIF